MRVGDQSIDNNFNPKAAGFRLPYSPYGHKRNLNGDAHGEILDARKRLCRGSSGCKTVEDPCQRRVPSTHARLLGRSWSVVAACEAALVVVSVAVRLVRSNFSLPIYVLLSGVAIFRKSGFLLFIGREAVSELRGVVGGYRQLFEASIFSLSGPGWLILECHSAYDLD